MAAKLATKCDLSKAQALEIITCIFETEPGHGIIAVELDAGRKVRLPGFGTFSTKHRASRKGSNPATGKGDHDCCKDLPSLQGWHGTQRPRR